MDIELLCVKFIIMSITLLYTNAEMQQWLTNFTKTTRNKNKTTRNTSNKLEYYPVLL